MVPVEFIIKEGDENLTSHSGLALVGALINRTNLAKRVNSTVLPRCQEPKISHGDILKTMIGLMCMAKPDYDAIEEFRKIPFFTQSLGIAHCPASPTLRQRIDAINGAFDPIIKEESAKMIRNTAPEIGTVSTSNGERVPLDIDVSPFDNSKTKKEGVSRTYKGNDGFAPILAYLGKEGYQVNVEFREGSQHSQKNTPAFLRETIRYAKMVTDKGILVRLDSGNDALDNIAICIEEGVDWLIKRNLRKEKLEGWLQIAQEKGTQSSPREGRGSGAERCTGSLKNLTSHCA